MAPSLIKAQVTEGLSYWENKRKRVLLLGVMYIEKEDMVNDQLSPPPPST